MNSPFFGQFSTTGAGLVSSPGSGPAGSLADAFYKNGTYDFGNNTLADFFVEDTDWAPYDPASVVAGTGLYDPELADVANPVLGSALTADLLASGFSAVWTYNVFDAGAPGGVNLEVLDLPDYNHEWIFGFYGNANGGDASFQDSGQSPKVDMDTNQGTGVHKAGMSVNPATGDIILVIDGGVDSDHFLEATAAAASPTHIAMQVQGAVAIERATFYPLKTLAELKTLTA